MCVCVCVCVCVCEGRGVRLKAFAIWTTSNYIVQFEAWAVQGARGVPTVKAHDP